MEFKELGEELKNLQKSKKITSEQMAKNLHISRVAKKEFLEQLFKN